MQAQNEYLLNEKIVTAVPAPIESIQVKKKRKKGRSRGRPY